MGRLLCLAVAVCGAAAAWAGSIDTRFLEQPWPNQWVKEYEVDKYPVRWRQQASKREGIFAGARFTAPAQLDAAWRLATDYTDLGQMTPGVSAVRFLEDSPTRQVIQLDVKVLWKTFVLTFEVEREPPHAIRFRLVHEQVGEYRGVCLMQPEGERTTVELATWLRPAVQVPSGLILWVERVVLLQGIRNFLEVCEEVARG